MTRPPPLVVVGMDAGDPDMIIRWVAEGRLPTIGRLLESGARGRLAGHEMVCEIGTGVTLLSGVSRTRHGVYDFRQLDAGSYDLVSASAVDDGAPPPFWAHLAGTSRRVAVVDAFETRVRPGLEGVQLSHWTAHRPSFPPVPTETWPPELLDEILASRGEPEHPTDWLADPSVEDDRRALETLLERVRTKGAICRELIGRADPDAAVVMFSDMHVGAHRFWTYRPEASGPAARPGDPVLTHAIRDLYEAIDAEMGRILELFPDDAHVVFVGMFGMKDHLPTTNLAEAICRRLGYQATPPGAGGAGLTDLARRILPAPVREWLGRRLTPARQHDIIARHLRDGTHWPGTEIFPVWSLFDSYFRVNVRGREPEGIVEPGDAYRALLDRFRRDLESLVDPVTGLPAVEEVLLHHEIFGEPPGLLPDVFVRWRPHTHVIDRVLHPTGVIEAPALGYRRESFHRMEGLVALTGPSVERAGDLGTLDPLGFAPTCLSLLGVETPDVMDGAPWELGQRAPAG